MQRKRRLCLAGAAGLAAAAWPAAAAQVGAPTADTARTLRIGVSAELTGAGALYGAGILSGAQMAADEINAAGGVAGHRLQLEVSDGGSNPARAAMGMRRLALRDIDLVVGGWGSSQVMAALEMSEQVGMPFVVTGATHPSITAARNRWTFRVVHNDRDVVQVLADTALNRMQRRRLAVVCDSSAYGVGSHDAMLGRLSALKRPPVLSRMLGMGAASAAESVDALVRQLADQQAEVLFLFATVGPAVPLLKAIRRAGLRLQVLGGGGLYHPQALEDVAEAAEGLVLAGLFHAALDAASADWARRYRAHPHATARPTPLPGLAAWTYRALRLIVAPSLDASTLRDREALRERLSTWEGEVFGVPGRTGFDDERQLRQPVRLLQVRGGRLHPWGAP